MTAKELRNEIVNRLWSYGNLPKNIQTLMTDNEVDFMMEVIKTHVQEQLNLYGVVNCDHPRAEDPKDKMYKDALNKWDKLLNR